MESNLLLEQYSWYKKQQLAKAPFECLLNADIEPNPHQVNAFCAAIQALKTGGIILADEVGLGKTIEAGLVLNYVLDNGAKKVLISLPATLRKQWEVELLEKFGRQAVILDRYTVEHDLANVQTHLGNADEVSIVIASYDYSSKLIKRFPHIFVAEHICRKILAVDEFYFAQRPILGRGRGCAATWKANKNGRASEIVSTFIPEYEFPGVSAALEGFDPFFFSMRTLSVAKKKDDIINRLNVLANSYEDWIQKKLIHDSKMDDAKFKKEIGDTVINKCIEALGRIRAGIQLLVEDDTAFDAFCFMNRFNQSHPGEDSRKVRISRL